LKFDVLRIFFNLHLRVGVFWTLLPMTLGIQGVWFVLLWAVALGNWSCFAPDSVLSLTYSKVDARGLGFS
jgi:hypothetical protein